MNNPTHPDGHPNLTGNPQNARRCNAKARTTGGLCKSPAIRNRWRCRMHGGKGSGAPKDNQNAKTSGHYTAKARAQQFWLAYLNWLVDQDDRHMSQRLTDPREIRELVKLLRHWGDAMLDDNNARALHAVANDIDSEFLQRWQLKRVRQTPDTARTSATCCQRPLV
jgi:hypothetical protein